MNMHNVTRGMLVALAFFSTVTLLHAETQPKFSLIPITDTTLFIPIDGARVIEYRVTNNTKVTRMLTMKPIIGISQRSDFVGSCTNPFSLAHNKSCVLRLQLTGSQLPEKIESGPVVCKTKGPGDNSPDPFLCSQPSEANSLHITRGAFADAIITVTPNTLQLLVGTSGSLKVKNNSKSVTALNITLNRPSTWTDVTEDATDCIRLAPGSSCTLTFHAGTTPYTATVSPVQGTNTTQAKVTMLVAAAIISVSPPTLVVPANGANSLTVTNISGGTATAVAATLPESWTDVNVTTVPSPCTLVGAGATCSMTFTSSGTAAPHGASVIPIQGSDTNLTTATVLVVSSPTVGISVTGSPLIFGVSSLISNQSPQIFTVTNNSTTITAIGPILVSLGSTLINAGVQVASNNCESDLAPSASCTVTFLPGNTPVQVEPSLLGTLTFQYTNSTAETAYIGVLGYGSLYQGGYVFALGTNSGASGASCIPGTLNMPGSLCGTVAAIADAGSAIQWSTQPLSSYFAEDNYKGALMTTTILHEFSTHTPPILPPYAAKSCASFQSTAAGGSCTGQLCLADWYLPAICQVSPYPTTYDNFAGCTGNSGTPLPQQNMYDSLSTTSVWATFLLGGYWGSTQSFIQQQLLGVYTLVIQSPPPFQIVQYAVQTDPLLGIRCARDFG